eukprot:m.334000 g.334000  ORF g.334000 m.334000 type:complete len:348 (-) comp17266_c0_seq1:110-1153(-)
MADTVNMSEDVVEVVLPDSNLKDMLSVGLDNITKLSQGMLDIHAVQLLVAFCGILFTLFVYHKLFAREKPGAWFEIHSFANLLTVLTTFPAVLEWIMDPVATLIPKSPSPEILGPNWWHAENLFHVNNHWGVLIILAVHTYHCLAFPLSKQDIFHHFVFVPTIGVYGGFVRSWGPLRGVLCFFISGFPGGVDYVFLTLMKRGKVSKLFQKRECAKINLWVRGPGVGVLIPATCYIAFLYGEPVDLATKLQTLFVAFFSCFNGIHYMEMAIKNYQMHLTKAALTSQHMKEMAALTDKLEKQEQENYKNYWEEKAAATTQLPGVNIRKSITSLTAFAEDDETQPTKAFR